jgi:hypothetical protein
MLNQSNPKHPNSDVDNLSVFSHLHLFNFVPNLRTLLLFSISDDKIHEILHVRNLTLHTVYCT